MTKTLNNLIRFTKKLCPVTVPVKTFIIPFFGLGKNRALTSLGGVSCTLYYMGEKNMKAKPPFTAVVYNTRRCNGRRRNTILHKNENKKKRGLPWEKRWTMNLFSFSSFPSTQFPIHPFCHIPTLGWLAVIISCLPPQCKPRSKCG